MLPLLPSKLHHQQKKREENNFRGPENKQHVKETKMRSVTGFHHAFLFLAFILHTLTALLSSLVATSPLPPQCDPSLLPDPRTLRADKLTVLLSGFSPHRLPLLRSLAISYSSHPSVSAVLLLWSNPNQTLAPSNLLPLPPRVTLLRLPSPSLNLRFLPRPEIRTRAVAVADDDVEADPHSLSFAFRVWRSHPSRLVGFFARSHALDLPSRSWAYAVHPDRYSVVLTKLVVMATSHLWRYSCDGGEAMAKARAVVDRRRNCEDILMNFVAARATEKGPVLVEGKRIRDYGDERNEFEGEEAGVRFKGGISAVTGHRGRRGECIGEFHRLLGEMPLRYSYGKVVQEVRDQGLCRRKGGQLVFCDRP